MNKRNAILLFGILALVCVIALVAAAETSEDPEERGTRAVETYVGTEECNSCHHKTTVYPEWNDTMHGIDFTEWDNHGTPANKYTLYGGGCVSCHVVGYNQTDIGGYDPAQAWNSSHNLPLLRIGCENCHGPGSAHIDTMSPNDINLGLDRYSEACGGTVDAECHGGTRQYGTDEIHGWSSSAHAPFDNSGGGLNSICAECKSPSQYDPTATDETVVEFTMSEWRGITCGDCHDPHEDTGHVGQLRWDEEEVCDVCHKEGHETMRTEELEGTPTLEREDYPYMEDVACVECHMFNTPHGTPDEYAVIGHSFEPTIEACVACHTDIYDIMPEETYNETNMAIWDAWGENLTEELETWDGVVKAQQERYEDLVDEVEELLDKVGGVISHGHLEEPGLKQAADENGTWTADMESRLENASYNFELADHASTGAHNPAFGTDLLRDAKELLMGLDDDLSVGILEGKVTDESDAGIAGVFISVNGKGTKTASDGTYELELDSGTYTVSAYKKGTIEDDATGVVVTAPGVTVQNFTLAADYDNDGTADSTDTDDDNDGIPDAYESANGMDPMDATDADDDDDADGLTNLQEYTDETDPQDSADFIKTGAEDEEEADNTMYLIIIVVLIVVIIIVAVMGAKKGSGSAAPPPEEPPAEEPEEEEIPDEE